MKIQKQKIFYIFKLIVFYFLSFTWGIIMSAIGGIVILFSLPFGRVHIFHNRLYAQWFNDWGGLELGCFFVCGKNCDDNSLCAHECGHGLQNCLWGPLFPLVIGIPSAIRYWYREIIYRTDRDRYWKLPDYDAIWFEGQATHWGETYIVTDKI